MWKEMRKFFIRQYVLIWLVVFFCLKVISTYFFSDADEVENREIYYSYLDEFGGKLDVQKEEALLARYDEFNQSSAKLNELEQQYDKGELTQEDYLQQLSEVAKIKQEGEVVKLFHSKYEYAAENPETHYIIDENGWTQLLTEEHLDYLLVLLLFLISVPMFCSEYETEMNVLQLCSKNGRERLTLLKILLLGLVAMAVAFLFSLVDFCFYRQKYGLALGDAPMQSLQFFEESIHHFTLMQLWWMVTFTRMVGALFLSMMILAVSVVVKKSLLSIVVNALLVSLPIVFSNSARLKYMLPLPTGLLYGTGYYFSDIYEYSYEAGEMEKNVSFQSFTQRQLGLIAGMTAVVLIGLIFVVVWKYLDLHIHRKKSSFVTAVLLVSLLTLGLSGCSREKEEFYENMSVQNLVSMTDQYQFTLDFLNRIICSDLETGESFSVLRNVFEQDSNDASFSVTFFATNQYLYYAKDYQETERNYDEHFEFQIYRVDLSDFLEECVYSKTYSHEDLTSFGLYFVSENYFYVHMNEDNTEKYYTINRRTGEWEWIPYAQDIL